MIKIPSTMSEPTPEAHAVADAATAARRLRPAQAAPAQRDPRADGCIDECLVPSIVTFRCEPCPCVCDHAFVVPFAGEGDM